MHFIEIKNIHQTDEGDVLHKLSFHNTIPNRSQSHIGHVIKKL